MSVGYAGVGIGQFRADRFGVLQLTLRNPEGAARELLSAVFVESDANTQFGRTLWIPAGAQRRTWQPLRVSASQAKTDARTQGRSNSINLVSMLLASGAAGEQMLSRQPSPVSLGHGAAPTALINTPSPASAPAPGNAPGTAPGSSLQEAENESVHDMLAAAAELVGPKGDPDGLRALLPRTMNNPPPVTLGYDSIARVVLASREPQLDAAQTQALRDWLTAGGVLWIMLDRVDPAYIEQLLGPAWNVAVADKTRLTRVPTDFGADGKPAWRDVEQPVDFVRVIAEPLAPELVCEGWPLAFELPYGDGRVIVTTLGPRGWSDGKTPYPTLTRVSQAFHADVVKASSFFFAAQSENSTQPAADKQLLASLVGYSVVGRSAVAGLLVGYCVLFILLAFVLHRRQKLERIGIVGLALAVVFAAGVVALGLSNRQSAPQTLAAAGMAKFQPDTGTIELEGGVDIYTPLLTAASNTTDLTGDRGGYLMLSPTSGEGRVRRILWTDLNRWVWRHVTLPADATLRGDVRAVLHVPPVAASTMQPQASGFALTSEAPDALGLEDVMLIGPAGAATLARDGATQTWRPTGDRIELSDASEAEAAALRQMYQQAAETACDDGVLLLAGWTSQLSPGVAMPGRTPREASRYVVTLPVQAVAPAQGQRFVVPALLLPFEVPRNGRGSKQSFLTAYDAGHHEWLTLTQPGRVRLQFTVPAALLPMRVDTATVELDIDAAGRQVIVASGKQRQTLDGPTRKQTITLSGLDTLVTREQPDVDVTLDVSAGDNPTGMQTWKIHSVRLTLEASPGSKSP